MLGRHDFEDHRKHARLQFIRFLYAVDRGADSQKRGKVASQPETRQKGLADFIRLKKNRIAPFKLHRDGRNELPVERLGERDIRSGFVFLRKKNELGGADLDAVAVLERLRARRYTVYKGAIE